MDDLIELKKGDVLFNQGDKGGALYLIVKGKVEIYQEKEGVHQVLNTLTKNEVMGLLTCLDGRPRTASAKAIEDTILKSISVSKLKKAISKVPKWISIIIKEFSNRLLVTQEISIDNSVNIAKLNKLVIENTYISSIIAGLLTFVFDGDAKTFKEGKFVEKNLVINTLVDIVFVKKHQIEKFLHVFHEGGLLEQKTDPHSRISYYSLDAMHDLIGYQKFVKNSTSGITKKRAARKFRPQEKRALKYLINYSKTMERPRKRKLKVYY